MSVMQIPGSNNGPEATLDGVGATFRESVDSHLSPSHVYENTLDKNRKPVQNCLAVGLLVIHEW